ncbi:peptide/nickel transport system permease protein [Paenibacillus phyllosphaerae]|uniref:Peptide/nickel transport system permease protein n=1 Tax=Paenibacillus phyllosphaerae TaxID=274593 RepID=A0A7W5B157_9BACL|nr:ABC transporter permease [Paenibacillus phyllosphaerae]MBB3112492.1 peptide/nickel transport system permease protein [Paenibacillus phyllosphaerae]
MREAITAKAVWRERGRRQLASLRFRRIAAADALLVLAGAVVLLIIACAIVPGWIAPYAPTEMLTDNILKPPSTDHLFGTDYFGRDIFSVVVHGSRDSLFIGFASVLIGGLAGGIIGAVSGYVGGIADTILMRCNDILMTIPGILLALAIAGALGPGMFNIVLAVAVASIPGYARVMRAQIISIKSRTFIAASSSMGASPMHIFWRHVLPNALSPLLVMATIGIGTSILTGSGLSFLGLGLLREVPDWGTLLSQGRGYLTVAWWMCTFPGLAITLFVLAVNIIGDRLRDDMDPKKRRVRG